MELIEVSEGMCMVGQQEISCKWQGGLFYPRRWTYDSQK